EQRPGGDRGHRRDRGEGPYGERARRRYLPRAVRSSRGRAQGRTEIDESDRRAHVRGSAQGIEGAPAARESVLGTHRAGLIVRLEVPPGEGSSAGGLSGLAVGVPVAVRTLPGVRTCDRADVLAVRLAVRRAVGRRGERDV